MLNGLGHDAVAVLDGGLQAWQAGGGAVASGDEPAHFQSHFTLHTPLRRLVTASEVLQGLQQPTQTVVDARAAPRRRVRPDPVAGHIPGALNRPFGLNLGSDGRFKPAACCAPSSMPFGWPQPATVVHQCGSGVSAIPNRWPWSLQAWAGKPLFAGSWSEWCSDPARR